MRLEAFLGCRPLLATARALYDAACRGQPKGVTHDAMTGSTTTHQGALGRGAFLDLHLSLSREGVLDPGVVGKVMSRYPFCYAAPRYVRRLEGHWPKRQPNESDVVETGEEVLTDEVTGERLTGRASSGLAAWDDGIRLWALLQGSGLVEGDNEHGGSISASAFEQIAFEIADAHVTFACMGDKADGATDTTQITVGASTHVPLQAYLDVLTRLVERVVTDEPPVPTRARKLEHGGVLVRGDSADGTDGTDGGVCECSPRLRHGWPCVGSEMAGAAVQRKLSVLHAAILANAQRPQHFDGRQGLACHEGVTRATLVEEWRRYRSALGLEVRGGSKLTFAQLDRAFRSMEGLYYERLTHRFATSTHGGEGVAEGVRLRARWADDDETLCLLRWLDQDGDGLLSKKDFLLGLLSQGHDAIPMLGKKWVALRDLRVLERSLARAKMDAQIPPKVNSRS